MFTVQTSMFIVHYWVFGENMGSFGVKRGHKIDIKRFQAASS